MRCGGVVGGPTVPPENWICKQRRPQTTFTIVHKGNAGVVFLTVLTVAHRVYLYGRTPHVQRQSPPAQSLGKYYLGPATTEVLRLHTDI